MRWRFGLGVALLFIEMTALVVAADAIARGERHKAWAWLCVFGLVVLVNLFADFGAVVTRSARDAEARRRRAIYDAASVTAREADADIARLTALLESGQRHRPVAALRAEHAAALDRVEVYQRIERQPPYRLVERAAAAEAALVTAETLVAAEARRDSARATMTQFGARPPGEHPQFEAVATLLNSLGVDASPGQVRVWLAVPIAIILKTVLVFGLWVLTQQERREGGDGDGPSASEAPPVVPSEPERRNWASDALPHCRALQRAGGRGF